MTEHDDPHQQETLQRDASDDSTPLQRDRAQAGSAEIEIKPKLRGVIHQYGFFVALLLGPLMVWQTDSAEQRFATTIYSLSLALLLGTSAVYHRVNWDETMRPWMRRLDHTMIFVLIAGTYTPFVYTEVSPSIGSLVLSVAWGSVLLGAIIKLAWPTAPKWLSTLVYLSLGWVGVFLLPHLIETWGWSAVRWIVAGGALYTIGALAYAFKRPNIVQGVFGYHEVFHTFVVFAAACHYHAVAVVSW